MGTKYRRLELQAEDDAARARLDAAIAAYVDLEVRRGAGPRLSADNATVEPEGGPRPSVEAEARVDALTLLRIEQNTERERAWRGLPVWRRLVARRPRRDDLVVRLDAGDAEQREVSDRTAAWCFSAHVELDDVLTGLDLHDAADYVELRYLDDEEAAPFRAAAADTPSLTLIEDGPAASEI